MDDNREESHLLEEKDDRRLAARLKGRDTQALRELVRRYSGYVSAVISNTLPGALRREDREELCADVFVALWHNVPELKSGASLKPWLAVVARNKARNRTRAYRIQEVPLDEGEGFATLDPSGQGTPLDRWDGDEAATDGLVDGLADGLADALMTLDERSRDILTRHYFLRQSVREIAGDIGSTEAAVKTRLHRGRRSLRKHLDEVPGHGLRKDLP